MLRVYINTAVPPHAVLPILWMQCPGKSQGFDGAADPYATTQPRVPASQLRGRIAFARRLAEALISPRRYLAWLNTSLESREHQVLGYSADASRDPLIPFLLDVLDDRTPGRSWRVTPTLVQQVGDQGLILAECVLPQWGHIFQTILGKPHAVTYGEAFIAVMEASKRWSVV